MNILFKVKRRWLSEIDPRVKLLLLFSYGTTFLTDNLTLIIIACIIGIIIFILVEAHKSIYKFGVLLMLLFLGIIGVVLLIRYLNSGDIIELKIGLLVILKWLSLISISVAFFVISSPYEIVFALQSIKVPKIAAFSVGIGFRFIPIVLEEFHTTLLAQKARGLNAERGIKLLGKIPLILKSITIPLLRNLFVKMDNMWISLNLKGISIESYFFREKSRFRVLDFLIATYSIALIILGVLL